MWGGKGPFFPYTNTPCIHYASNMRVFRPTILLPALLMLASCGLLPGKEEPAPEKTCPDVEVPVCPPPRVIERVVIKTVPTEMPPMATTAGKLHLPIIGAVEWARVDPPDFVMEARIDTGAETTSIHAEDISLVERDGKRYVKFSLADPQTGESVVLERRLKASGEE